VGEAIEFTPVTSDNKPLGLIRIKAVRKHAKTSNTAGIGLLRVSKAARQYASPIWYGQEFRFSSSFGWIMLYHFLLTIGRWNQQFLRNLTVHIPFERSQDIGPISITSYKNLDDLFPRLGLSWDTGYHGGDYYPHQQAVVRVCGTLQHCKELRSLKLVFHDGEPVWRGAEILPEEEPFYQNIVRLKKRAYYKPRPYPMLQAFPIWAMLQRVVLCNKLLKIKLLHLHGYEEVDDEFLLYSRTKQELTQILDSEDQRILVNEAFKRGWAVERMYYDEEGRYPINEDDQD
jgi:hypothetical protein